MTFRNRVDIMKGLAMIEQAAIAGERCPTNDVLGNGIAVALLKEKWIRTEVYAKNYRVVEILKGKHAGRRTKAAPEGWVPYRVVPPRVLNEQAFENAVVMFGSNPTLTR